MIADEVLPKESAAPACSPETRRESIGRLQADLFDVVVLGGGINGAGVARDLALRARRSGTDLRIGLIEQRHFASGTSGKNSQLIHGGLRYLKQLQFRLVSEALRERAILLRLASHLVEPQRFLMPVYGRLARAYYGAGLGLYDLLAGSRKLGPRQEFSRDEIARLEPGLASEDLAGALVFYDCRVHSARFVLANVFDAVRNGAAAANYVRAEGWSRQNGIFHVDARDTLSGERFRVRARVLVDTTGPWSKGASLRLVRGSHLLLPRVNSSDYAIAYFEESGRIVFLIPWVGARELTLVGTTDVDHDAGPDEVRISADEIHYLLRIVRKLFPSADLSPVGMFSSLRPLLRNESKSPAKASREHSIWMSPPGVLHVAGGKYTTYRSMSEEAADRVARRIAPQLEGVHLTAETPLEGNSADRIQELFRSEVQIAARFGLSGEEAREALKEYGIQGPSLLRYLPETAPAGLSRLRAARIAYAVRHEMAQTLADVMFVSTYWGYESRWSAENLTPYAREAGRHLGWDADRERREIETTLRIAAVPEAD